VESIFQSTVTRLHASDGFSDLTSPIPSQKAFSIHLHLCANRGGSLWLSGKLVLVPTGKRPLRRNDVALDGVLQQFGIRPQP
jgi:hypothetical protein